jgi:hypothetical protein
VNEEAAVAEQTPTRLRMVIATLVVIITLLAAWTLIDYRTQPPPPPHPVGASIPK